MYPRLQSRRVSSALPGSAPLNPSQPASPPERAPPLGIFSGEPMPPRTNPLPLADLFGNSNPPGNSDWFNFLAGIASQRAH